MRISLPAGVATVLGALPAVAPLDASKLLAHTVPRLPAAPTVVLSGDGSGSDLFEPALEFLESLRGRVAPIVLSITGPATFELDLLSQGFDAASAAEAAVDAVTAAGLRLLDAASSVLPDAPLLLFLEEPGLVNSMHPTFPMTSSHIESLVERTVRPLSEAAMVGLHVDGRADWAMLLRTGISVLGAPITAGLDTAAVELGRFLESGGFVAWGAVAVDEPLGTGSERQWLRLTSLWAELARLGLDPLVLREQSIITPAAGLGNFGLSQAERILRITADLGERVLTQVRGARLSVGA